MGTVDTEYIRIEHLPANIVATNPLVRELGLNQIPENVEELKAAKLRIKERVYQQIESSFVLEALQKTGWNVTHAAKLVGMKRPNFHALMRKCAIRK